MNWYECLDLSENLEYLEAEIESITKIILYDQIKSKK